MDNHFVTYHRPGFLESAPRMKLSLIIMAVASAAVVRESGALRIIDGSS